MPTARAFLAWAIPLSFALCVDLVRPEPHYNGTCSVLLLIAPMVSPAACRTAMLRRFRTLMLAMAMNQGRKRRFIVAPGGLGPDVIRHRVRPVAHPREGLSERQGGTFGVSEVGCLAPSSYGSPAFLATRGCMSTQAPQPLIWLARRLMSSSVRSGTLLFLVAAARAGRPSCHRERSRWGVSCVLASVIFFTSLC